VSRATRNDLDQSRRDQDHAKKCDHPNANDYRGEHDERTEHHHDETPATAAW
jgi:hypothetical protein